MTMRRPQFTLKTLLWLMVCVGALFGGRHSKTKVNENQLIEAELNGVVANDKRQRQLWDAWYTTIEREIIRLQRKCGEPPTGTDYLELSSSQAPRPETQE